MLVEAKAHLSEFDKADDATGAEDENSLAKIRNACAEARFFYDVPSDVRPWESRYYQVANRLTHLWWMHAVPKRPTWLIWVFFTDDRVTWPTDALSAYGWSKVYSRVMSDVGLTTDHNLADRIAPVYLPPSPGDER